MPDDPVVGSGAEHLFRREIFQGRIRERDESLLILLRAGHREEAGVRVPHGDVDHIVVLALHHIGGGDLLSGFLHLVRILLAQFVEFRHHPGDVHAVFRHLGDVGDGAFPFGFRDRRINQLRQEKAVERPLTVELLRKFRHSEAGPRQSECEVENHKISAAVVVHPRHMHVARGVLLANHVEIFLELEKHIFAERVHRQIERAFLEVDVGPRHRLVHGCDPAEVIRLNRRGGVGGGVGGILKFNLVAHNFPDPVNADDEQIDRHDKCERNGQRRALVVCRQLPAPAGKYRPNGWIEFVHRVNG